MRGLSSRSYPGSSEESKMQTPHLTCSNENFCLPSTHHGAALETFPEGPTSFGVFHNKGLASWIQPKPSLEVSLAEMLPTICPFGKSSILPKSSAFLDPAVLMAAQDHVPEGEGSHVPAVGCTVTWQAVVRALH